MLRGLISFCVVLMIVTEGSSVKVDPGGNTTLPCSIKNDKEITWIITNGNQTFIRILRLEYLYGGKSKPEPSNIHPSYAGRIRALSSSTNTHSLLLMNITDTDLMLYCCTDYKIEQTHCTKLDYEEQQNTEEIEDKKTIGLGNYISTTIWLPVICVLLLLSLMSNVCMCWRINRQKEENLKESKTLHTSTQDEQENEADGISYASVNINKTQRNRGQHHLTQDTVYASIK
ncbi:uncharacterized protein LOC107685430 [Sinocyclocheilus anshuiensis]|uniref:uncharacterized protein LOC107685430 n=1 Tax=Sinocyclocheilus anshuiensis TaxID=1608454 RepID=UPI0007B9BEE2|nr:PREDICTED: uncharacterized protein LOC107685430 [Sinocyclocheilus anshuiensis]